MMEESGQAMGELVQEYVQLKWKRAGPPVRARTIGQHLGPALRSRIDVLGVPFCTTTPPVDSFRASPRWRASARLGRPLQVPKKRTDNLHAPPQGQLSLGSRTPQSLVRC
jgi:hypothetical protein